MTDATQLVGNLLNLHRQGSLRPMNRGAICVGCGDQWPCSTANIVHAWLYEDGLDD